MAQRHGLSPATVNRAYAELRMRGEIRSHGARGLYAVKQTTRDGRPTQNARRRPAWQRADSSLRELLARGTFGPGMLLPSQQQLRDIAGTGLAPLRMALRALERDGLVERQGRGYRVTLPTPHRAGSAIVAIGRGYDHGISALIPERSRKLLDVVDTAATDQGVSTYMLPYSQCAPSVLSGSLVEQHVQPVMDRWPVVGFLLWPLAIDPDEFRSMVRQLSATGLPVACADDHGCLGEAAGRMPGRMTCVFATGGVELPGVKAAEYLHGLGHRHVAFVGLHHGEESWRRARLKGLVHGFAARAHPNAVRAFGYAPSPPLSVPARNEALDAVFEQLQDRGLPAGLHGAPAFRNEAVELRTVAERIIAKARDASSVDDMFSRALRWRKATAWVAANDGAAIAALRFLAARHVDVPRRVSVLGFDNTLDATLNRLTSYDFNLVGTSRALLDFILSPRRFRSLHGRRRVVQLTGWMTVRASTGAVK